MTTKLDLTFKIGENWRILFVAHNEDDTIMTLDGGADVRFRLTAATSEDGEPAIENVVGDGVTITNASAGAARIDVTAGDQVAAELTPEVAYFYEIQVTKDGEVSSQAEGRLIVQASLFGPVVNMLLRLFRVKFPEIEADDATVMMTINDVKATLKQENCWYTTDLETATLLLAAHSLAMKSISATQYASGGLETGAIRTISIEDRTVSFGNQTSSGQGTGTIVRKGYAETAYGRQFQALSLRQVRTVLRA